jgi:hypothetical protein
MSSSITIPCVVQLAISRYLQIAPSKQGGPLSWAGLPPDRCRELIRARLILFENSFGMSQESEPWHDLHIIDPQQVRILKLLRRPC